MAWRGTVYQELDNARKYGHPVRSTVQPTLDRVYTVLEPLPEGQYIVTEYLGAVT